MSNWHCMDCQPLPRPVTGVSLTTGLCRRHYWLRTARLVWRDFWAYRVPVLLRFLSPLGYAVATAAGAFLALTLAYLVSCVR